MNTTTITPPTYPARPLNGGPLSVAMPKSGEWFYEPKYNGWRTLVHVPSRTMFNREGQVLTITGEFTEALNRLEAMNLTWLDCEGLERRHNIGRGSLIILDYIPTNGSNPNYKDRRYLLETAAAIARIPRHMDLNKPVPPNSVLLTMSYVEAGAGGMWQLLQLCNKELGCEFFEGLVAKRGDSQYPLQLRNPKSETPWWIKHRWAW